MVGFLQSREGLRVGIFLYQSCQIGLHFYLRKLISYQKIETAYLFEIKRVAKSQPWSVLFI